MIFRSQKHQRECDQPANIGGGRLTERVSSDVGGSRGLDRVERRLRAEAANIPLSNKGLCERRKYKRKREGEEKGKETDKCGGKSNNQIRAGRKQL